jgi:hypothetical protein
VKYDQNYFFNIDTNIKKIGVLFSGGIDSTVLLSVLQLQSKIQKFEIIAFNIENSNSYEVNCRKILSLPFFSGIKLIEHVNNAGIYDGNIRAGIIEVLKKEDLDLVYLGINKNPDIDHPSKPVRRTKAELQIAKKLRYPFIDLTKDAVLKLFYGIDELKNTNILDYTHSCTSQKINQCGQCFQCVERSWAFNIIGRSDPYQMRSQLIDDI